VRYDLHGLSLPAGTRLGPYEIVAPLGAGGMGEVFKARDTRLDRTVAIKVLPAQFAANPELRTRFEREARAVSSLDHPNICVLHDVGRAPARAGTEQIEFLVMQYLEGETLAARLARGPLPVAEALRYGIEIASALDRAHRAGILHRDLKPGNVMLARSAPGRHGAPQAKLLDFGLAKVAIAAAGRPHTMQPTASSPLTGAGNILGTLQYMAPEQLEGRDVDARADIFSFGAMLYEMVTGTRPFDGNSQASIIAAVLDRDPPPITASAPLTPAALDRVVRKCLAKDPDQRWQSAHDLGDELSWIAQGSGINTPATLPVSRPSASSRAWVVPAAVGIAALTAGLLLGWALFTRQDAAPPVARQLSLVPPEGVRFVAGGMAISPDARLIAYVAAPAPVASDGSTPVDTSPRLYLRRFDTDTTTAIAGTNGAKAPFFSPDGLWIAYFTDRALMKVSVLGGTPVKVAVVPPVTRGGVWLSEDRIVLTPAQTAGLMSLNPSESSGLQTPTPAEGGAQLWPAPLPGNTDVIYTRRGSTARSVDDADVVVQNLRTGERKVVVNGGAYARYSPSGHLLFVRGTTLMAVPFDAAKTEVKGTPLPIAESIAEDADTGGAHYAIGPDATLVYLRGAFGERRVEAVWVDRSGRVLSAPPASTLRLSSPRLSPDGRRALFTALSAQGDAEIFSFDTVRGSLVRFTTDTDDDFNSVWTPDGSRVIYTSFKVGGLPNLVWRAADGGGAIEKVVPPSQPEPQFAGSVSTSGDLAYTIFREATRADIYVVPLTNGRKGRPFVETRTDEYGGEFSPDGRWLAYVSNESGIEEVYVAPYPGPGSKRLVSRGGGVAPAWCRTCGELYYQSATGMMAVSVTGGPEALFGAPRVLFGPGYSAYSREDHHRDYDVTPDGRRFLMLRPLQNPAKPPTFEVVIDWVGRLTGAAARSSER